MAPSDARLAPEVTCGRRVTVTVLHAIPYVGGWTAEDATALL